MSKAINKSSGFTLIEVLVASSLLMLVIAGILTCHIAGLRIWKVQGIKAKALTDAYIGMSQIMHEVRGAYGVQVGNQSAGGFTLCADNTVQAGNALQIYRSPLTNDWFLYFFDPGSNTIYRADGPGGATPTSLVVSGLAETDPVFQMEVYSNNVFTVSSHTNRQGLISINLQFKLDQGSDNMVYGMLNTNYYKTRVSVSPRRI